MREYRIFTPIGYFKITRAQALVLLDQDEYTSRVENNTMIFQRRY